MLERIVFCLGLLVAGGFVLPGSAGEGVQSLERSDVEQLMLEVEGATNLTASARRTVLDYYEQALKSLELRDSALGQAREYEEMLDEMKAMGPRGSVGVETSALGAKAIELQARAMSVSEVEEQIARLQMRLGIAEKQAREQEQKPGEALPAPEVLQGRVDDLRRQLNAARQAMQEQAGQDEASPVEQARRTKWQLHLDALEAGLEAARQELALRLRQDEHEGMIQAEMRRQLRQLQDGVAVWNSILERYRHDNARIGLRQALTAMRVIRESDWGPRADFLTSLATNNMALARRILDIADQANEAERQASINKNDLEQLASDFEATRKRVAQMGLSREAGDVLRARRASLQLVRLDGERMLSRRDKLLQLNLAHSEVTWERQYFNRFQEETVAHLEGETSLPTEQSLRLSALAHQLLHTRQELLERADNEYARFQEALNAQYELRRETQRLSREFRDYINKNLAWSRSSGILPEQLGTGLRGFSDWLKSADTYRKLALDGTQMARRYPAVWLGLLGLAALLYRARQPLARLLSGLAHDAQDAEKDTLWRDLEALLLLVVRQCGGPLLLLAALALVSDMPDAGLLTVALARTGMAVVAWTVFVRLVAGLSQADGFGQTYLRWDAEVSRAVSGQLRRSWSGIAVLLALVTFIQEAPQIYAVRQSLGRLLFVVLQVFVAQLCRNVAAPGTPAANWITAKYAGRRFAARYGVWSRLLCAIPWVLIAMTVFGYYFTAYQLARNIAYSLCVLPGLLLLNGLLQRGMRLTHLRYLIAVRRSEEEAARAIAAEPEENDPLKEQVKNRTIEVQAVDSVKIDQDVTLLIRALLVVIGALGAWWIWAGLIPATDMLGSVHLWRVEIGQLEDGMPDVVAVTLLNLLQSAVWLALMLIGFRAVPTLLNVLLTRSSKMDAGARNAVCMLSAYFIGMVGIINIFSVLHIRWDSLKWVIGPMTFALSFGLQDIFSNFVSGIIILFERPIRIGDVVTVSGITGKISNIRVRATTVTDWDRKEVVIPNKAFLSDKIINWSLSDDLSRSVIEVGVAYGTDVKRAEDILMDLAANHPLVLKDPAPSTLFSEFGADSLNLQLRVFSSMADRAKIQHQMRHEINRRFIEAGIEIPFAQRDTHLDTPAPLQIQLVPS